LGHSERNGLSHFYGQERDMTEGGGRPRNDGARRDRPPAAPPRSDRPERGPRPQRPGEPALLDDVSATDLESSLREELSALSKGHAAEVGAHLAAAITLFDDDPEAAYQHALAARKRAGRLGGVREVMGLAAYLVGKYDEALSELRAARRITGRPDFLPLIADAERGLGRPERALAVGNEPDAKRLDKAGEIELRIVLAGARRDLGQPAAAVALLRGKDLDPPTIEPWTVRLWYAYADALLDAGRRDEARRYFEAVASADDDGETDASERLGQLGSA
jgi:tetratricopeptide (TPR) repeat protein